MKLKKIEVELTGKGYTTECQFNVREQAEEKAKTLKSEGKNVRVVLHGPFMRKPPVFKIWSKNK
jgi:hypothetical protein